MAYQSFVELRAFTEGHGNPSQVKRVAGLRAAKLSIDDRFSLVAECKACLAGRSRRGSLDLTRFQMRSFGDGPG